MRSATSSASPATSTSGSGTAVESTLKPTCTWPPYPMIEVEKLWSADIGAQPHSRVTRRPATWSAASGPRTLVVTPVAEDEGGNAGGGSSILGYAVASFAGDIAELQRIGVDAGSRRSGVASALLREVVRRAPGTGADRMLLEVRADNAGALAFYAARDFVEIDRRPRYYRDGTDAVVMRLPLVAGCGGRG